MHGVAHQIRSATGTGAAPKIVESALVERDEARAERDTAMAERDAALAALAAMKARDDAQAEADAALEALQSAHAATPGYSRPARPSTAGTTLNRYESGSISRRSIRAALAFSTPHVKERCPGCGLWKSKADACEHCETRPNRMQVALQKLSKSSSSLAIQTNHNYRHPNERCKSCGLWKNKARECYHCASRPNRMQASATLLVKEQPKPACDTINLPRVHAPEPGGKHLHRNERCKSCGLWKNKARGCRFCARAPNRIQVGHPTVFEYQSEGSHNTSSSRGFFHPPISTTGYLLTEEEEGMVPPSPGMVPRGAERYY